MTKGPKTPNRVNVVLSDEGHAMLKELARKNFRSLSGQVLFLISEAVGMDMKDVMMPGKRLNKRRKDLE